MPSYHDYWFTSPDNLTLYAREYPHNRATPTLLCLHGLTRNSKDFAQLSEHLNRDYRVIAVDFRGRGKSDYDSNPGNYQPVVYAEDMLRLIDTLKLEDVILIGTSLGGLVSMLLSAQLLSAQHPSAVSGIVLNDIGPELNPGGLERIKQYISGDKTIATWDEALQATRQTLSDAYLNLSDKEWLEFTHNLYREDENGHPVLDYDKAIAQTITQADDSTSQADLWPVFEMIKTIPMLLVRGELSDLLSPECVAKMQRISGSLRYCEVADRGHAPTLTEPECLSAIDEFLANITADNQ